ncbi:hypothetical protein [Pseudooceanicola nitratireducens]|uniref:hypothetical protein n=1 Tax=Pseudooceanicola nitratireducens TaxID=517719 RepID=UPI0023EFA43D|nr:hypothetical protein [Pseudooceanicola nitratireducens]
MITFRSLIAAAALATAGASGASALSLTVVAHANGFFGGSFHHNGATAMIEGVSLSAGDSVAITASGQIAIGENIFVGPNGEDVHSSSGKVFAFEYTPLEEAAVDATPSLANLPLMPKLGALIGAFVAQPTVDASGFVATNVDVGGGINSTDLFFVGESLTYTAAFDGTLFFGINEAYVLNNSLAYAVALDLSGGLGNGTVVPLPAGMPLLASALGLGAFLRRRSNR